MASPSEAVERWQQIERALEQGGPLPDEVHRYLLDVAQKLNMLVMDSRKTPEQAAALVPEAVEMTGHAIRAYREERRAEGYGWLFGWSKQWLRGPIKNIASDLAKRADVDIRTLYRWEERWGKHKGN